MTTALLAADDIRAAVEAFEQQQHPSQQPRLLWVGPALYRACHNLGITHAHGGKLVTSDRPPDPKLVRFFEKKLRRNALELGFPLPVSVTPKESSNE